MPYKENRVYLKDYASLPADSPLLAPVRTAKGYKKQYVHHLVAEAFESMDNACYADLGFHLEVASGRRDPKWPNEEAYEKDMIAQYGSVKKGRKYRAFQSPHQTGLCIDLLCGGIAPVSATIEAQKKTRLYAWLVKNMWRWGFTPYLAECWHIEHRLDLASYWAGTVQKDPFPVVTAEETTTCSDDNDVCEAPNDWRMV